MFIKYKHDNGENVEDIQSWVIDLLDGEHDRCVAVIAALVAIALKHHPQELGRIAAAADGYSGDDHGQWDHQLMGENNETTCQH